MWLSVVFSFDPGPLLDHLITSDTLVAQEYDVLWMAADTVTWAAALELQDSPGSLSRMFGLISPYITLEGPMFSVEMLKERKLKEKKEEESRAIPAPAAPYVSSIPIATPQDTVAKAPEKPVAGGQKVKKSRAQSRKKPGAGASVHKAAAETETIDVVEDEHRKHLPELLPDAFKLNCRNTEIFHRLLGSEEKSGQIRWGDFEKAMKQAGFKVAQTEGSSIRFDPPAKKARPITFHRPHPESTMTPIMLKWVAARLKRTYGWTASMFAGDNEGAEVV